MYIPHGHFRFGHPKSTVGAWALFVTWLRGFWAWISTNPESDFRIGCNSSLGTFWCLSRSPTTSTSTSTQMPESDFLMKIRLSPKNFTFRFRPTGFERRLIRLGSSRNVHFRAQIQNPGSAGSRIPRRSWRQFWGGWPNVFTFGLFTLSGSLAERPDGRQMFGLPLDRGLFTPFGGCLLGVVDIRGTCHGHPRIFRFRPTRRRRHSRFHWKMTWVEKKLSGREKKFSRRPARPTPLDSAQFPDSDGALIWLKKWILKDTVAMNPLARVSAFYPWCLDWYLQKKFLLHPPIRNSNEGHFREKRGGTLWMDGEFSPGSWVKRFFTIISKKSAKEHKKGFRIPIASLLFDKRFWMKKNAVLNGKVSKKISIFIDKKHFTSKI